MIDSLKDISFARLQEFDSKLKKFRNKYAHLTIKIDPIDITDCFLSISEKKYICPYSYSNVPVNRIIAYVVFGGSFVEKYAKDHRNGKVIRDSKGIPIIQQPFTLDMDIISSICVYDLRNTSFHEIKQALTVSRNIQGYRRWHIRNIEETFKAHYPNFNSEKDSAFIFAGSTDDVFQRLRLNALWLSQIISNDKAYSHLISVEEYNLMKAIFPQKMLRGDIDEVYQRSYMFGKPTYNPLSTIFLYGKIMAYQSFNQQNFSKQ